VKCAKPDFSFDEQEVCKICREFESRSSIDWERKEKEFVGKLNHHRLRNESPNTLEKVIQDDFVLPFPRVLRIEPASQCNLQCLHCPTGTVALDRGIMKDDVFDCVLSALKKNRKNVKVVVLYHGGEPFLNKKFFEMVKKIKSVGDFMVKTDTNGMVLTDHMIENIVTSGLNMIVFSLDGHSSAENDFVRRNCDFNKVVKNIKQLMDYKKQIQSKTPDIFVSSTQFKTLETLEDNQSAKAPEYLLKEFSGDYALNESSFKLGFAMKWPHMEVDMDVFDVVSDPLDNPVNNYCDHTFSTITVRSDGDVVPCCYDLTSQLVVGNIVKDDLSVIWNNENYRALRKSIYERKLNSLCSQCWVVQPFNYLMIKPKIDDVLGKVTSI
jgi:radical SAM protein with 4Fe4S-binding SPASM domain